MEKKLRLLLADDDSDDRELFKSVLSDIAPGIELLMANDGQKAIEFLTRCGNNQLPNAVILDYNMPNLNASQVLEWICARSWYNGIHKFVWSTSGHADYKINCLKHGASEYFVKPTNHQGLEELVHTILEKCELMQ